MVSPHRRAIQTAIKILESHPQFSQPLTITLYPYIKEQLSHSNDLVVSRKELETFTNEISAKHPNISFDYGQIDELLSMSSSLKSGEEPIVVLNPSVLKDPDFWPIHILKSKELRNEIFNLISEYQNQGKH